MCSDGCQRNGKSYLIFQTGKKNLSCYGTLSRAYKNVNVVAKIAVSNDRVFLLVFYSDHKRLDYASETGNNNNISTQSDSNIGSLWHVTSAASSAGCIE